LLLSVFQIKLNKFSRARSFVVDPLTGDDPDVRALRLLEKVVREVFCTEHVLLTGLPTLSGAGLVPWWSLGFWSALPTPDQASASSFAAADPAAFLLSNWTASFSIDVDAKQMGLGAALASAIPVVRDGEEQHADGLSGFALPDLSFQAALGEMTAAIQDMKEAGG
jgi:hypothetical protein